MANLLTLAVLSVFCACISAEYNNTAEQANKCRFYSSCREIYAAETCAGRTPANGQYTIVYYSEGNRVTRKVYCDMTSTNCGEKGWMRIAGLDMTVAGSKCPPGLDPGVYGNKRLCGNRGTNTCRSTTFNTFGVPYTAVCGFVLGYQYKTPDAFRGKNANINSPTWTVYPSLMAHLANTSGLMQVA